MKRHPILLLFLCAFTVGPAFSAEQDGALRVGTARRDVTPKEPVPMWGYGARHAALSQGTLDPLYATAVVVELAGQKVAIVGLDLGRSPAEKSLQNIRQRIKTEAGIEHAFIAGSHTHHGPVLELTNEPGKGQGKFDAALRYYSELEDGIVAAIVEASKKLVPAKLGVGSVKLDGFNRNRHTKIEPKAVDRELAVLRLDDASGKPIAVLANFAAHPTMTDGSVLKFSADYVGAMRRRVETEVGASTVFMQGACGDLSTNAGERKGPEGFGDALGREVVALAQSIKTEAVAQPQLQVREERFKFASRTDFSNPALQIAYATAFFPELVPNYADEYADGVRPRLTVALMNREIVLVGVSGEVFCNHSIRLKERARVRQVFFFGYCNGYHQYFPTIEAVAEGGYGADALVSPVAPGAGEQLMNTALLWIYQMLGRVK